MGFTKGTKTLFIINIVLVVLIVLCLVFTTSMLVKHKQENSAGDQFGWGLTFAIFWPFLLGISVACTLGSAIPFFIMLKKMKGKVLALNLTAMIACAVLAILVGVLPVIIL